MRLKYDNIRHISVLSYNGNIYSVFVATKSRMVSDSRQYCNKDNEGRTSISAYDLDLLPKCVKKYLSDHTGKVSYETPDGFKGMIYRD